MGKRRTANKAPRTPLSRRKEKEKEAEESPVTPRQELAMMGLCKDDIFMCSQAGDSQRDVRWDCNSPEALQQIKRYRGPVMKNDIADLVMKLAEEAEDLPTASEPLFGLWNSKDNFGHSKPFTNNRIGRPERRRRNRRPSGSASIQSADELLEQLTTALHRHEDLAEEERQESTKENHLRESPGSCELLPVIEEQPDVTDHVVTLPGMGEIKHGSSVSRDLFESPEKPRKTRQSDAVSTFDGLVTGTLQSAQEEAVEDQWSDDDLFDNDSLLMKASSFDVVCSPTPQPTSRLTKRKCVMNSPSEPEVKTKRFSEVSSASIPMSYGRTEIAEETILAPKFMQTRYVGNEQTARQIKPECTKQNGMCVDKLLRRNISIDQQKHQNEHLKKMNPTCGKSVIVDNSVVKSVCVSGHGNTSSSRNNVIPSSQTFPAKPQAPTTAGRTFKRHNTFPSVSVSPRNAKIMGKNEVTSNFGHSDSQAKSENFKVNGTSVSRPNGYTFYKAVNGSKPHKWDVTQGREPAAVNKVLVARAGAGLPKPFNFEKSPVNKLRRRSSFDSSMFDTSLTDDILCQLAEPDEILDSQFDMGMESVSQAGGSAKFINSNAKQQVNQDLNGTHGNHRPTLSKNVPKSCNTYRPPLPSSRGAHVSIPLAVGEKVNPGRLTKNTPSVCQPSQSERPSQTGKYHFKSLHTNSAVHAKPVLNPSVNVPHRTTGQTENKGKCIPQPSTETVQTSAETPSELVDSFFNDDDDLSNPEVLAMLDEVEVQATQATQASKSPVFKGPPDGQISKSPVFKCTPDEIEKKKQAAMLRRKKNLQLEKKKPAARPSSRHYKPLF